MEHCEKTQNISSNSRTISLAQSLSLSDNPSRTIPSSENLSLGQSLSQTISLPDNLSLRQSLSWTISLSDNHAPAIPDNLLQNVRRIVVPSGTCYYMITFVLTAIIMILKVRHTHSHRNKLRLSSSV